MSWSNSVLRRYTPATCTLEIAAKDSPLSYWVGRPVLKHLRFQLRFDDPRLSSDQQVHISGDRAQLEALCEAVDRYVQNFLTPATYASALPLQVAETTGATKVQHHTESGEQDGPPLTALDTPTGIYLKPKGLLAHDLFLGPLSTETSGSVVHLSALQLFDLANALDDYSAEALSLPTLNRPSWISATPAWAKVAAVLVLAVGVTASIIRFVDPYSNPAAVQTAELESEGDQNQISSLPAPEGIEQPETIPPAPLELQPLPPPPVGETTPPANPGLPSVTIPRTPLPNLNPPRGAAPSVRPDAVAIAPAPQATSPSAGAAPELQIPAPSESAPSTLRVAPEQSNESLTQQSDAAPPEANNGTTARSTAFDAIPQVAEARTYFQERWQPPEGLTQTLEYRLLLNADGSIQRIIPLGQAAGDYIDRTEMPLVGEPFVSPIESGGNPQIRLVLSPDGNVRTFLEAQN